MLWFCKCLQSWIGIKSLIWELSLNCVRCQLSCESQRTVSKKSVSSSLCQIKQFLSYFQWKVFLYLLLRKNTSNQQKLKCGLTLYFCNNYFRWNSWFVCLRWYRKSVISPNCLDHSNKVTVVIFLATYFLFNMIKPRSGNKSICLNLSLLTRNTKAKFLIALVSY